MTNATVTNLFLQENLPLGTSLKILLFNVNYF